MSLRKCQSEFTKALGLLLIYAYSLGCELTLGDTYPGKFKHSKNGKHPLGIAIDINLFYKDSWLKETSDHEFLGTYWKKLGGIWGGDFKNPDGNHYEWPEPKSH